MSKEDLEYLKARGWPEPSAFADRHPGLTLLLLAAVIIGFCAGAIALLIR